MPVTHKIDEDTHIITMEVIGPISAQELVDGYEEIFAHKHFSHNMNAVWDLSKLELRYVSVDHVRQLPRYMNKFMAQRGEGYKAALVTSRPLDYQLMRAYLAILRMIGDIRFKVFRSLDQAYAWVNEPE